MYEIKENHRGCGRMSLHEQQKELFARHADVAEGKYISVETVKKLLGKDAVQYVLNAIKDYSGKVKYWNIYGDVEVLTFDGFSMAFGFFRMMEIKEGKYNAWQTPDYLVRRRFKKPPA